MGESSSTPLSFVLPHKINWRHHYFFLHHNSFSCVSFPRYVLYSLYSRSQTTVSSFHQSWIRNFWRTVARSEHYQQISPDAWQASDLHKFSIICVSRILPCLLNNHLKTQPRVINTLSKNDRRAQADANADALISPRPDLIPYRDSTLTWLLKGYNFEISNFSKCSEMEP